MSAAIGGGRAAENPHQTLHSWRGLHVGRYSGNGLFCNSFTRSLRPGFGVAHQTKINRRQERFNGLHLELALTVQEFMNRRLCQCRIVLASKLPKSMSREM